MTEQQNHHEPKIMNSNTNFTNGGESQIKFNVEDWQTTHEAVRDWINSDIKHIHVLLQTDDTLILVQRDSRPVTDSTNEGQKVVGLSIHADDDIVVQSGTGHEQGFDATEEYVGDFGSIGEGVAVALDEFFIQ